MSVDAGSLAAIWQDVESGGYAADLATWDDLAGAGGGPVAELGAGTGRVALRLARSGHEVTAVDTEEPLLAALRERAAADDLQVDTVVRRRPPTRAGAGPSGPCWRRCSSRTCSAARRAEWRCSWRRAGICNPAGSSPPRCSTDAATWIPFEPASAPLPDVLERDGWVYSSQPTEVAAVPGGMEIRRLRQTVSPDGELTEAADAIRLDSADGR